ncbi:hypothetical protein DUI87_25436 [Hirundo rustica rustica]|uniref:C-type lectin domain-containing protein n=1 Tax=Hirundo rustica rustica TaxID=333673 RepID=A0A3M0JAQ3_HIRRU|nr:hypothetical protein DUI87_25436 [Hirundo rustica rustica]
MCSCLLIALALLGAVPVSCFALASPVVEDEEDVTGLEMPEEYSGCPVAGDKQALCVPSTPGTATCHYVMISRCQNFHHAQIPTPNCHWTDQSPWNYSRWVPGHPLPGHYCTTLCTNNGLWRSVRCERQLPFICEI